MEEVKTTEQQTEQEVEVKEEAKTYNQSELDSHISKAVATALKNNDAKWQKQMEEKLKETKTEAEAYAKMTAEEKRKAETEKERKAFEAEKAAFEKEKLLVAIKKDLQDQNLPMAFADSLVNLGDAEKIKAVVEDLKKTWDEEIAEAIKSKARQSTPKDGGRFNAEESRMSSIGEMARNARIIK